ncbi:excisionase [Bacteriophage APSE-2]|uniref:Excisionase n=3 Tax=root TaxID=1 RepID=B6SCW9_9CAUD|nr:excisionase [Bacteriophage APSE-2]ACJ10192.1 excisionase [Bacteriophage APSE-2]ACQ68259.1 APSE-2 prophage: excisionase [Bacteriophage APSE-2] [Candidatus Hamiltonella defensa 5AT (Acyrthosiphon pisum)]
MRNVMNKATLTRQEAAKIIGISEDTLTNWCKLGIISYQRKNPYKKKSPYLFTKEACIEAVKNSINTLSESEIDVSRSNKCQSSNVVKFGTAVTQHRAEKELRNHLAQRTKNKLRSYTTNEKLNYGE